MLADSPVVYLRLGEPSGTNANDETVNNRDGTYQGAVTLGATGALTADPDTAVTFTNDTTYVSVPDQAALDLGDGPLTLECWVKTTSTGRSLISKGQDAYDLRITGGTGTLEFQKQQVAIVVASTVAVNDGNWHHVVYTKSGASSAMYVDGVDRTGTVTNATLADTAVELNVGRRAGIGDSGLAGSLDEAAIYNKVLTGTQVLYHYQAGTNTVPPSPPPSFAVREKPPLPLHAELVAADGTRYRWAADRTDPRDVPSGVSFASKRYEGFERGSARLNRPVDRDYPDLGLFDSFNLVGYDASTAYEGMLGQVPRSTPFGIGVETTGWMAHARHRKFRDVYVDKDKSRFGQIPARRKVNLLGSGFGAPQDGQSTTDPSTQEAAVRLAVQQPWQSTARPIAEAWYDAGLGVAVGSVFYSWTRGPNVNNADPNWVWAVAASPDTGLSAEDSTGDLRAAGPGSGTLTTTTADRRFVRAQLFYAAVTVTAAPNLEYDLYFTDLAVFGNQGLTKQSTGTATGYYASDLIKDICSRWCPRLNTAGVQGTTWPVPQAAWHDRTDPYDAWLELNKFHLWELAVWEDRTLFYGPSDLSDYDWEVRTTDPGVTVELQGDSTDHLANFAVVQFTNSLTGAQDEVSPDTHPELEDLSTENPANRNGLQVEFGVTLSDPTDPDSAAQIGVAALAENNQPRAIGTITFKGHVRDRAGHWQQGWKVRATDTVAVTDWPNNRPRLIGEVEWDHNTKTGTIAVDSTLRRVDAFLDRYGTALRAAGL